MTKLQVFQVPGGSTLQAFLDERGAAWFLTKDVCRALALENAPELVRRLEPEEQGTYDCAATVSESGLYSLALSSRQPGARVFRRWVTNEVLPALRREGYSRGEPPARGYMTLTEAIRTLRDCAPELRPSIHKLLRDFGFDLPPLQNTRHN